MKTNPTQIVKIGPLGTLTLCLPELEGQYLLVEQEEGRITLSTLDLDRPGTPAAQAIAAQDARGKLKFLGAHGSVLPRA